MNQLIVYPDGLCALWSIQEQTSTHILTRLEAVGTVEEMAQLWGQGN